MPEADDACVRNEQPYEGIRAVELFTNRLELIAATMGHVCAELEAPESLAALLHAWAEPGWPPGVYDRNAQEFFLNRLKEQRAFRGLIDVGKMHQWRVSPEPRINRQFLLENNSWNMLFERV